MLNCLYWETLAFKMESKILLMVFHTPANLNMTQFPLDAKCFCASMSTVHITSSPCQGSLYHVFLYKFYYVKLNLMPYLLRSFFTSCYK